MCGIIGYAGDREAKKVILEALETLEYRGYDSAGMALVYADGHLRVKKSAGKVAKLRALCEREDAGDKTEKKKALSGIGHTRWATHGGVSDENAHPHTYGRVTLVHNGIIENFQELAVRYGLEENLVSQTDTEVVAALIDKFYDGDAKTAIWKATELLKGTFALAVLFADIPDKIFAIRNVSPIIAGVGKNHMESFLASDVTALSQYVSTYFVVPEYVLVVLEAGKITLLDGEDKKVDPDFLCVDWQIGEKGKNGYEYFMEKEIAEQPKVIRETILCRCRDGMPDLNIDNIPDWLLDRYENVIIIGCGTAMHAGLAAKRLMQTLLKIPVTVELASEFVYDEPVVDCRTFVIAVSQSGETIDTLEALKYAKRKGAGNLSIVNVKGSTIARESEYVIYTNAGPEIAVASTKAYTTQITALYMLICRMAYVRGVYTAEQAKMFVQGLQGVPESVEKVIADKKALHRISQCIMDSSDVFMIGRGLDYTALLEGSLKLKEISYIHSDAYASGELKHGTIALITEKTPVIALLTQPKVMSKELSNAIEVRARGAKVYLFTRADVEMKNAGQWENVYRLPALRDELMVFPAVVALQLVAYYVSRDKGLDVDKPRNLAKVVTVE
ncbi:MAG: glutamine--fructose-6-phosphate transaminase (isomerizing) [Lachnospiraceae bacterium]|nr:glutamine--fructose-6-phosphate transaminase (isomerizing) [Lachnospiraceae bacterium]